MKGKFWGSLMLASSLIFGIPSVAIASENADVIPPTGRIAIIGAAEVVDNVNYVESPSVTIQIYAQDNVQSGIKYYLSTTPLEDPASTNSSAWHDYYDGVTENIIITNSDEKNTVYLVLKDAAGNTSTIYKDASTEYTVTYNANGGINAPVAEKAYYGMPFNVSNKRPTYEGKYFLGWSTSQNADSASYYQGSIIPADIFVDTQKNITLYAVWTEDANKLPLLSNKVKIGDYVDYPLYYENVPDKDNKIATKTGWRVISKDVDINDAADSGRINLVSAGVPMSYYHTNNSATTVKCLTENFLNTPIRHFEFSYIKVGFGGFTTLKEAFTNEFTLMSGDSNDIPVVRAMKGEDILNISGQSALSGSYTSEKYQGLLHVDETYWLASAHNSIRVWRVIYNGEANSDDGRFYEAIFGIRPVISLTSNIRTTGYDMSGVWNMVMP